MVPLKEFLPKITAAIEAKATPDIIESDAVELRARGQLLEVTDIYKKLEKTYGGWVGNAPKIMLEPDGGSTTSSTASRASCSCRATTS